MVYIYSHEYKIIPTQLIQTDLLNNHMVHMICTMVYGLSIYKYLLEESYTG